MRRANNKRHSRSKNQAEKRFLELTAKVEVLLEALARERLEKKVDETKQEIKETGKTFLEVAARLRLVAEKYELSHYVTKIDELVHNVEAKGELLLGRFDSFKSLVATETVGNTENNLDTIHQEAMELFEAALLDLKALVDKIEWHLMEQRKKDLRVFRKVFPEKASRLALLARAVKADKKLAKELAELIDYIADAEINIVIETDELNKLLLMQDISEEDKLNEFARVFDKELDYCEKVREEFDRLISALTPYIQRKQQRQRLVTIFTTIFMILSNIGLYFSYSYQEHMILPGWSETTTWILSGIILTIIATTANWFISFYLAKHLFTLKRLHPVLTHIIAFSVMIFCGLASQITLFIIVYHFLYIAIYYGVDFLSFSNPTLNLFISGITIFTVIPICVRLSSKYFKKIFIWLPEK